MAANNHGVRGVMQGAKVRTYFPPRSTTSTVLFRGQGDSKVSLML